MREGCILAAAVRELLGGLPPVRPRGWVQHRGDHAALAVEHHDRLEAVFIVVGVEQTAGINPDYARRYAAIDQWI